MFVILTNRIDQKQTTVAENKLSALEKYVSGIFSVLVQQYEQEKITRHDCYPEKTKNTFQSTDLLNSTKTTTIK